jgi:type IV pilus assembly protein PilM
MAITKACWGIDVGQCALKAIKLRLNSGEVEAVSFDVIEHAKILSQPDADEQQLIRNALDKFLSRNSVRGDLVVVGVPGQASFSRFIKLPPVELRRVPEIVRYEARQQIPFNLDEVIWQHQVMAVPTGGPAELEVGIFAMKRDIVQDYVNDFLQVRVTPDIMQMAPVALYNYLRYDRREGAGATLLVDVGAENTSLVIADGNRVWIRNFPLGGNNFTQALVKGFKLTFTKAENLKRHASESKYAREVFQAMRPVFSDLLTEIQRSIGFYTSLHRESRIERVLAMGASFRLAGLQKFLSQNLGVDVIKVEQFNTLHGDQVVNAPVFKENVVSFGVAYGLALQGIGLGTITTSLLPPEIAKARELKAKRPFAAAAAAALVAGAGLLAYGAQEAVKAVNPGQSTAIGSLPEAAKSKAGILSKVAEFQQKNDLARKDFEAKRADLLGKQRDVDAFMNLERTVDLKVPMFGGGLNATTTARHMEYRDLWYWIASDVWDVLPAPAGLAGYDPSKDRDGRQWQDIKAIEVLSLRGEYDEEAAAAAAAAPATAPSPGSFRQRMPQGPAAGTPGGAAGARGTPVLKIHLIGTTPHAPGETPPALNQLVERLKQKGYFQQVQVKDARPAYKDAPGYTYEKERPKQAAPTPAPGTEGAAGTEAAAPGTESVTPLTLTPSRAATGGPAAKPVVNPWRGDDYWFELVWHVNLADMTRTVHVDYEAGAIPGQP